MFKYVWIIMLVIAAVIFIGYTIYAIYDSYCDSIICVTRPGIEHDIKWILFKTLDNFRWRYDTLCGVWCVILVAIIFSIFAFSLYVYGG